MAYDLSTYRGDAVSFAVTLSLSGAPLNLDDYLAFFTVKKKLTDPDSKAVIRKNRTVGGLLSSMPLPDLCPLTFITQTPRIFSAEFTITE